MSLIYLPPGEHGEKVGLDDFFAAKNTPKDLMALATPEVRPLAVDPSNRPSPYLEKDGSMFLLRKGRDEEEPIRLTNFLAHITREITKNDGLEKQREYEIEARLGQRQFKFSVPAGYFGSLLWIYQHLGATAIMYPGLSIREHTKVAIQVLSGSVLESEVFVHTGWRLRDDGNYVYLHEGGAIGEGDTSEIRVQLESGLEGFVLPSPPTGESLRAAVRACLQLGKLGPLGLGYVLLATAFRAVLGGTDFCLFFVGPSGTFKTEVVALLQQFFGAGLNARNLPGSWSSTDNSLEGLAFLLKDTILVIDDFAPAGSSQDAQRLHAKADRVIRGQGNGAGRGRMNADGTLRPTKKSRSLIVVTGEDKPNGHSLRARTCFFELAPGDIAPNELTRCQADAGAGVYAQVTAAFCEWLAPQYAEMHHSMIREVKDLRIRLDGPHARTPDIQANLMFGWRIFLEFALNCEAISSDEADQLYNDQVDMFNKLFARQGAHQTASDPVSRYLHLLGAAIDSGEAHVADLDGEAPEEAAAWGWRSTIIGSGENERHEWRAAGVRLGWVDGENLYLSPDAAYKAVQKMGSSSGGGGVLGVSTINKRLHERGHLQSIEKAREVLTVRRMVQGKRVEVLHLRADVILGTKPDQPDQEQSHPAPDRMGPDRPVHSGDAVGVKAAPPGGDDQKTHQTPYNLRLFDQDGDTPASSGRVGRDYRGDEPYLRR